MTIAVLGKGVRRGEILEHATKLFAAKGYDGASMSDLAEAVGLRKASLFHHFASKEEIYTAVLAGLLEAIRNVIAAAAGSPKSFEARTDTLLDALVDMLGQSPYTARLLLRELMSDGPVMKTKLAPLVSSVLAAGKAFAEAGQAAKVFTSEVDAAHMVISTVGLLLVPFAVHEVTSDFIGKSPFTAEFVAERKREVRVQLSRFQNPAR